MIQYLFHLCILIPFVKDFISVKKGILWLLIFSHREACNVRFNSLVVLESLGACLISFLLDYCLGKCLGSFLVILMDPLKSLVSLFVQKSFRARGGILDSVTSDAFKLPDDLVLLAEYLFYLTRVK